MTRTSVKIKKGWVIKTIRDKDNCNIVATKKFFEPKDGGFASGEITYSVYHSYKNKPSDQLELNNDDEEEQ